MGDGRAQTRRDGGLLEFLRGRAPRSVGLDGSMCTHKAGGSVEAGRARWRARTASAEAWSTWESQRRAASEQILWERVIHARMQLGWYGTLRTEKRAGSPGDKIGAGDRLILLISCYPYRDGRRGGGRNEGRNQRGKISLPVGKMFVLLNDETLHAVRSIGPETCKQDHTYLWIEFCIQETARSSRLIVCSACDEPTNPLA